MQQHQTRVVYRKRTLIILKKVKQEESSTATTEPTRQRMLPTNPKSQGAQKKLLLQTVPIGNVTNALMLLDKVERDSVTTATNGRRTSFLTNSRRQRPAGAVNYAALQRVMMQTVFFDGSAPIMLGINKRTFRLTPTAFGTDVLPCFLCIGAAEVGDLFEDPVDVFYKPWETRVAALIANNSTIDLEKAERLLNKEVGQFFSEMWMDIEKIHRCPPMVARSVAMFWMRRFFEALDAIVVQASKNN
jgi:hypothetical protein